MSQALYVLTAPRPLLASAVESIKRRWRDALGHASPPPLLVLEPGWKLKTMPASVAPLPAPAGWEDLTNVR